MSWFDTMVIPIGAPNGVAAARFMDYVYDPVVAAKIAAYVNYVTPVRGAKEELAKTDPDTANNTLIFPDDELLAQLKQYDSEALNNDDHITRWQQVLGQ